MKSVFKESILSEITPDDIYKTARIYANECLEKSNNNIKYKKKAQNL